MGSKNSSNKQESNSDQDKAAKESRAKIVGRVQTKRLAGCQAPGWMTEVSPSPMEPGICEKCEVSEANRCQCQSKVDKLESELASTRQTIVRLHDREEKMKDRLLELKMCDEQIRISSMGSSVWVSHSIIRKMEVNHDQLVSTFVQLYSQTRLDTLDNLDKMLELRQAEELKSKLLFSIIVLSFRSVHKTVTELKQKIFAILQVINVYCVANIPISNNSNSDSDTQPCLSV